MPDLAIDTADLGADPDRWAHAFRAARPAKADLADWFAAAIRAGREAQRADILAAARSAPYRPAADDHQDFHL